jgi:hypothetical protein
VPTLRTHSSLEFPVPKPSGSATASTTSGTGSPSEAGPGTGARAPRIALPLHARRIWLIGHVASSVGWLGLTLGVLTFGIVGRLSHDRDTARAAYLAMRIFADWLLIPVSLLSLATGTVLGLGTRWGLLRHWWVAVKFWLTLAAATASIFALRMFIHRAAAEIGAGATHPAGDLSHVLIIGPSVALTIYLFTTVLSVLKPWGLTGRGRRLRPVRPASAPKAP